MSCFLQQGFLCYSSAASPTSHPAQKPCVSHCIKRRKVWKSAWGQIKTPQETKSVCSLSTPEQPWDREDGICPSKRGCLSWRCSLFGLYLNLLWKETARPLWRATRNFRWQPEDEVNQTLKIFNSLPLQWGIIHLVWLLSVSVLMVKTWKAGEAKSTQGW